jgi:hypothetical protein
MYAMTTLHLLSFLVCGSSVYVCCAFGFVVASRKRMGGGDGDMVVHDAFRRED